MKMATLRKHTFCNKTWPLSKDSTYHLQLILLLQMKLQKRQWLGIQNASSCIYNQYPVREKKSVNTFILKTLASQKCSRITKGLVQLVFKNMMASLIVTIDFLHGYKLSDFSTQCWLQRVLPRIREKHQHTKTQDFKYDTPRFQTD